MKYIWDYEENEKEKLFPDKIKKGAGLNAHWICKKNRLHKEKKQIYRVTKGEGCGFCAGRNKTTEEWIEEAREKHGDLYDYSKVEYKNCDTLVTIKCKIHGEFDQNPTNHLSGSGCPYCAKQGGFHKKEALSEKYPLLAKEWPQSHLAYYPLRLPDMDSCGIAGIQTHNLLMLG